MKEKKYLINLNLRNLKYNYICIFIIQKEYRDKKECDINDH